ncbi:hypothetical protein [Alicyclobacillus hesperidum]|uniref:hypothetical protein n=1 Tax=Alicyclobacillus hesperidum TaxID=89784 RepID=UPI0012FE396E|nr:hypothetical protein [Alicyclobacillus hesperidum]
MRHKQHQNPSNTRKSRADDHRYPKDPQEYEKLMRHDAFRKMHGRLHQTKWADRS